MKKNKVIYFRLLIDFILKHTRILIGCLVLVITIYLVPSIYQFVQIFTEFVDVAITPFIADLICGFLVSLLPLSYAYIARVSRNWNRKVSAIKRSLYRKCLQLAKEESSTNLARKTAELLIHVFYFQKRSIILEQQRTVNHILGELSIFGAKAGYQRVFWIQGSPYSGKTMTAFNLFVDLISKQEYAELFEKLDGRIAYIDLGRDDFDISDLLNEYRCGKYEKHLLVLDNLHKTSGSVCINIVNQVVLNFQAHSIIILLRKPQDFLYDSKRVIFLEKTIRSIGTQFTLNSLSSKDFIVNVNDQSTFHKFCLQFGLEDFSEDVVTVHLLSIYLRRSFDKETILKQIQLFLGGTEPIDLYQRMLTAIISTSLFTGSFSLQALQICEEYSATVWKGFIQKLTNIGFLVDCPTFQSQYFYFHETIAKMYFKKNYMHPNYRALYLNHFKALSNLYYNQEQKSIAFLYSVLQRETPDLWTSFDEILINSNFVNLFHELEFLLHQDEGQRPQYYRELGMLCDRIGKLHEAKFYYLKYLSSTRSPDAFYKLLQIDHDYINRFPDIINQAINHSDYYYRALAKYWDYHIMMHEGFFDFQGFKNLVLNTQEQIDIILNHHIYDGIHLLRRLYFDCFRIYYLNGMLDPDELSFLISESSYLKQTLQSRLDEFEAYYLKFAVGQFLGQDLLFSLAFLSKGIDRCWFHAFIEPYTSLRFEDMHDVYKIAAETIVQYNKAIEKMEQIGDKSAVFIRYHMYNVKLCLVQDCNYSECEQFYEDYMAFASRENDIEYQSYAELFKLKMLLVKINSPAVIAGASDYDDMIKQAEKKIQTARNYQELCNTRNGNAYASLRLDIYEAIYKFMIQKMTPIEFKIRLLAIRETAEKKQFQRELHLINYIEKYHYNPSREQLRIIVTYYPIITQ